MRSRKSCVFTKILAFVLFTVLVGICLLSKGSNFTSYSEEELSFRGSTAQRLGKGDITKVEILDDLQEELCCDEEESIPSRLSMRFFQQFFLCLLLAGLFHVLIRNFLSISIYNCMLSTVIIDYIHKVDGKIRY